MVLKKHDVSKFTLASVEYEDCGCIHILLDTPKGKFDVSNHRWLKGGYVVWEQPLNHYVAISEDKISMHAAKRFATDDIKNQFLKDSRVYEETEEGKAKLTYIRNQFMILNETAPGFYA